MHAVGPLAAARALVVESSRALAWLEEVERSPEYVAEAQRTQRIHEAVDEARRLTAARRVTFAVEPEKVRRTVADLPEGVTLTRGELHVTFTTPQELLQRLFTLAKAHGNGFPRFERLLG